MRWTVPTGGPRASRSSEMTQKETVSLHSTSGEVCPALQEEQPAFPGHRHGSPASFPWWALLFGAPGSAPFPGAPIDVSTAGPAAPSTGRVPTLPRIPQSDPRPLISHSTDPSRSPHPASSFAKPRACNAILDTSHSDPFQHCPGF